MELALEILLFILAVFAVLCWSGVAFCLLGFGIAKWQGWLEDWMTPEYCWNRITGKQQP